MITQKQVQDCVKSDLLGKTLTSIAEVLGNADCLPPETVEGREWENPRRSLLTLIEFSLERLYDDAHAFAAIDLSGLKPGE